jgi:predicted ATPase/DNA-binding SARP family transcriptional activator
MVPSAVLSQGTLAVLEFRILGPLEASRGGRSLLPRGPGQQALLASLLLNANHVVPRSQLVDDLWGEDPPESAAKMVQMYVSELRKLLEPEAPAGEAWHLLQTRAPGYMLQIEPDQLDAHRFARLTDAGRRALDDGRPSEAVALLDEALALWRGPPLADVADRPFAQAEAARLEELRLAAVEDRIEAELALGRHATLVGELEPLVAAHPLRERLRRQLMLALYRSGRQAEALEVYKNTRELLINELGIEPSRALHELELAILRQEPSLEQETEASAADGAVAAPPAARAELRKTVSVVVVELASLGKHLDPEVLRRVVARVFADVAAALERHGGQTERIAGQRLMAVFGIPTIHEDDALRAVRAAVDARAAVASLNRELAQEWGLEVQLHASVHTGEVLASQHDAPSSLVADETVEGAIRLGQAAGAGDIVIGSSTERLVRGAVQARLLGPAPAGADDEAWLVAGVDPHAPAIARRADTPMVGRERELSQLRHLFARAVTERSTYLCVVLGPPGIGKTRVAAELRASLGPRATVLFGHCLSYGEGITFWPLAEAVREAAGGGSYDAIAAVLREEPEGAVIADRLAAAIGLTDATGSTEETFSAARKFFEAMARERPLVVVFDDIHWAEPMFLDLIEHVVDWSSERSILLLGVGRPELLEERPLWAGGSPRAAVMRIEPLSELDTEELIDKLLGEEPVPEELRARVAGAAGGNPLFIEQMLALIAEEGADPEAPLRVPSSLQALIAARLDRLAPEERMVLGAAAVVGTEFSRDALVDGTAVADHEAVDLHLRTLIRREFVTPALSALPGEQGLRFRHLLIHDAAYDAVPKQVRAELHERLAAWLAQAERGRIPEYDEIIGHHLAQAYGYRAELEPVGEEQLQLADRAAGHLAAAGRRASARADMLAAERLISRAAALLPSTSAERPELLTDLGEVLRETGEFDRGDAVLTEAIEAAAAAGNAAVEAHARLVRVRLRMDWQADPSVGPDDLTRVAEEAIALFERLGDDRRLARAWFNLAWAPWVKGSVSLAERALERAIEAARRAGDERTEAQSVNLFVGAGFYGPTPVTEAARRCEELLARPLEQRRITAAAYRALAGLRAMEGDFDEARRLAREDRAILEDLGLKLAAAMAAQEHGLVEILAGDADAAEQELRAGYAALEEIGETSIFANLVAMLAQVLYGQGRDDEALRFSEIGEDATARDDLAPQVQWRAVRAKLLARAGDVDEGERLAREAVALAEGTPDFLLLRADALSDLAEVLAARGDAAPAVQPLEKALELYEQKGNVVSASAARRRLADLSSPAVQPARCGRP